MKIGGDSQHYYAVDLFSPASRLLGLVDNEIPSVLACVHLSSFYINLYISFIYEDVFTLIVKNVYSYKNFIFIKKKKWPP